MALFGRPPAPAPLSRLEELKRLVAKEPASRQFLSLAEEYRKAGKFIDVVQTLQAGLQYNQNYVAAWVALGRAQHQIGKIDEAIRGYGEALRLDPHNLVAVRQLAELHLQKGDKVEAIKKFKLFRGLSPGDRAVNETIEQLEIDLKAERALKAPRVETWPNLVPPKPTAPKTPEPAIRTSPITAPVERPVVPPIVPPVVAPAIPSAVAPAAPATVPPVAPPRPAAAAPPETGWRPPQEPRPLPLTQSGAFRMPLAAPAAGTTGRIVPPPLPPRLENLVRATPAPAPPAPITASPAPAPDPLPAAPPPVAAPQPSRPAVAAYAPVPPPQPPAAQPKAKPSDLLELTFDGTSGRTTGPIPRTPSPEAPTLPPPAPPPPSWAPLVAPERSERQPPEAPESRAVTAPVPPPAPEPAVAREPAPPPQIEVASASPPPPARAVEAPVPEALGERVPARAAPAGDDVFGVSVSAVAEAPSPGPDRLEEAAPFDEPATTPIPPPLEVPPPPVAAAPPVPTPAPAVTETLASLYEAQGYAGDAAAAYESLAATAPDPERARELAGKAERARTKPAVNGTVRARLEAFAAKLPVPPEARLEDLGAVLRRLRGRVPGIQAAAVTDLEGLPVVVSEDADEAALEALIAELTAFWKSVLRRRDDVGTGALSALTVQARDGVALVSLVSPEYSLIVRTGRDVPIGQVRYEAERAAALLRPALA